MSDKFLFDSIKEEFGRELRIDENLAFVNSNLNPKLVLRDYQKQAFTRFYKYYENDDVEAYTKPSHNIHLAYHMATGSGKTVIMAGLILYLYEKGYRNFLFFVNRGQIVEKTKDNFINAFSSKYLFSDKIIINNKQVSIKAVDNFAYSSHDDINICFTTIQGLFSDFHNEKENSLTIEDFKENKIALIADEAHHINASTRRQQDWLKPSWENTVEKIFTAHKNNILLEFSATIELDNKEVREKYLDKIIYQYDLKSFVTDGFSKKINLFKSDTDKQTRILQALVVSMYREHIAIKHRLNIKPVVLFKSAKISQSKDNQEIFHGLINELQDADLENIKNNTDIDVLKQAFDFFDDNDIKLNLLIEKIKIAFDDKKCLCTNSDKELESNQKRLNNLEDKNNSIRAIFTVDKLNEGWDVLNLFDIVRLNEGQGRGGSTAKISKKTVSEAQLIGRGARYCPFKIKDEDNIYIRKFDNDITHELRILEELYFHSETTHQYISEITQALIKEGLMDEVGKEPIKLILELKDKPKLANKLIFKNERQEKSYNHIKNFTDFGIVNRNLNYDIYSGKGTLVDIFDNQENTTQKNLATDENFINLVGVNIVKNAILNNDFFTFANLKKSFPNLLSINDFIISKDYMGQLSITISNKTDDLLHKAKLNIALSMLNTLEQEIKGNIINYQGTKIFKGFSVNGIFDVKTPLIPQDKAKTILDIDHDWFVFNKFYGTSEEKSLIELIDRLMDDMKKQYKDIYLLRNERHFALYDFAQGRRFEPDFVLLAKNDKINYQFFIEPKGKHLQEQDKWKQDFLLAIKDKASTMLEHTNQHYNIIGLKFYSHVDENSFKDELTQEMEKNYSI